MPKSSLSSLSSSSSSSLAPSSSSASLSAATAIPKRKSCKARSSQQEQRRHEQRQAAGAEGGGGDRGRSGEMLVTAVRCSRREIVGLGAMLATTGGLGMAIATPETRAATEECAKLTETPSGLSFCDTAVGSGVSASKGLLIKVCRFDAFSSTCCSSPFSHEFRLSPDDFGTVGGAFRHSVFSVGFELCDLCAGGGLRARIGSKQLVNSTKNQKRK